MDPNVNIDTDSKEEMIIIATRAAAMVGVVVSLEAAHYLKYVDKNPHENTYYTPQNFVKRVTRSDEYCHNLLRMNVSCFTHFVETVRRRGSLHDTIHCSIKELAIFVHIIAYSVRVRNLKCYMKRSGETVGKYFNRVLDALLSMQDEFIKPPSLETPHQIAKSPRWMPYFKLLDCTGAIDRTHIPVKVEPEYEARFYGHKHRPTQNVFVACNFDLKFTYVLAGWEGSMPDSGILINALSMNHKIPCLPGKFYPVDVGYPLMRHFITPNCSILYHLSEFRGRQPTTAKKLCNHSHSALHNVIERASRVLKKRFRIICEEPMYSFKSQIKIVVSCCCVHNHIHNVMPNDTLLEDIDRWLETRQTPRDHDIDRLINQADKRRVGKNIRNRIKQEM